MFSSRFPPWASFSSISWLAGLLLVPHFPFLDFLPATALLLALSLSPSSCLSNAGRSRLFLTSFFSCLFDVGWSRIFPSCPIHRSTKPSILQHMLIIFWNFDVKMWLFLPFQTRQCKDVMTTSLFLFLQFSHMFLNWLFSLSHGFVLFKLEYTLNVYMHSWNKCCMFSSARSHNTHLPGPLHPFSVRYPISIVCFYKPTIGMPWSWMGF